jgi:hypothetical protein
MAKPNRRARHLHIPPTDTGSPLQPSERDERDTKLFSHQIAKVIHDERQREIEQRLRFLRERAEAPPRLSIRRRLGLALIRIGSSLASDHSLQVAARR